jgi:hypothetical protein
MPCQILALSLLLPRLQRLYFNACSFEHSTVCYKYRLCCCHAFRRPLARVHASSPVIIYFNVFIAPTINQSLAFGPRFPVLFELGYSRLQRLYFNALSDPRLVSGPSSFATTLFLCLLLRALYCLLPPLLLSRLPPTPCSNHLLLLFMLTLSELDNSTVQSTDHSHLVLALRALFDRRQKSFMLLGERVDGSCLPAWLPHSTTEDDSSFEGSPVGSADQGRLFCIVAAFCTVLYLIIFTLPRSSFSRNLREFIFEIATLVCNDFISMPCQILDLSLLFPDFISMSCQILDPSLLLPRLQRLYFNALLDSVALSLLLRALHCLRDSLCCCHAFRRWSNLLLFFFF